MSSRIHTPAAPAARPSLRPPDRLATFAGLGTVLSRAVGPASAVRYATAHRLRREEVLRADVEVVVRARQQAERWARARRGPACTLHDVAVELARLLGLDAAATTTLEATELAVERQWLTVLPAGLARVERARADGAVVGFLEDTLLPADLLRDVLEDGGALRAGDGLWVCHELGSRKSDGGAYLDVARRLGGRPRQWVHVGPDPVADGRMARRAGVRAEVDHAASSTRYEELLEAHCSRTAGLSGLLAGASASTRSRLVRERSGMPRPRAEVVAGAAGPLLAGYVLWCLRRAVEAGVRRLYFVARDGEVMLAMARRLTPALGEDAGGSLDLRYLHGSRQAWLRSAPQEELLVSVLDRGERLSVRGALAWLGRTPEELRGPLSDAGLGDWDHELGAAARRRLVRVAVENPVGGAGGPDPVPRYLRDVGLLDDTPYGIVDGTGHGTIGHLLTQLVERHGGAAPVVECYYGLDGPARAVGARRLLGYAYDEWRGVGARQSTDLWVALEMFLTASHGSVVGYEWAGDTVRPVLGPLGPAEGWGAPDVRAGLETYAEELARTVALMDAGVPVGPVTDEAVTLFWTRPSREEVRSWGTFPFQASTETYPVAQPFSTVEVARSLLSGRLRSRRWGSWPAGTVRAAPPHLRVAHLVVGAVRPRAAALRRAGSVRVDRRQLRPADRPSEPRRARDPQEET